MNNLFSNSAPTNADTNEVKKPMLAPNVGQKLGTIPEVEVVGALLPIVGGLQFGTRTPLQHLGNVISDFVGDITDLFDSDEPQAELDLTLSLARLAGMAMGAPLGDALDKVEDLVEEN